MPPSTCVTKSDLWEGRADLPQVNRESRRQGPFYFQCKVTGPVTLRAAFKVMSKASLLLWSLAALTPVGEGPEQPVLLRFLGKQTQANPRPRARAPAVGYTVQCGLSDKPGFSETPLLEANCSCWENASFVTYRASKEPVFSGEVSAPN